MFEMYMSQNKNKCAKFSYQLDISQIHCIKWM